MSASDPEAPFRQTGWPGLRARLFHTFFLIRRPMTLGVRAADPRPRGRIGLPDPPHLCAGLAIAGRRRRDRRDGGSTRSNAKLREECEIALTGPAELRSVHFNRQSSRRDHVLFYLVSDFRVIAPKMPDREIAEAGFFPARPAARQHHAGDTAPAGRGFRGGGGVAVLVSRPAGDERSQSATYAALASRPRLCGAA